MTHINQYKTKYPLPIRNNLCGVVSMYHIYDYYNKKYPLNVLFERFVTFGKYTKPVITVNFNKSSFDVPVLFLENTTEEAVQIKKATTLIESSYGQVQKDNWTLDINSTAADEYLPTFLLDRGTDFRGVKSFLESDLGGEFSIDYFEFKKNQTEDCLQTMDEFLQKIEVEHGVLMVSVLMSKIKYLKPIVESTYENVEVSHIVDVISKDGNLLIMDSAVDDEYVKIDKKELFDAVLGNSATHPHFIYIKPRVV